MAGERSEAATSKRLEQLRDQGRVARSTDLGTAVGLLAGFVALQQFGGEAVGKLSGFLQYNYRELAHLDLDVSTTADLGRGTFEIFLSVMMPLLVIVPLVGLISNVGQVGFTFSKQALEPKFSHINPLEGFGRLFSLRSAVDAGRTIIKVVILGYVFWQTLMENAETLSGLAAGEVSGSLPLLSGLIFKVCMTTCYVLLGLGILDYGYQRWQFQRDARMSKDEIKEEYKQAEGSPQIRAQIRRLQRQMAQRRMMAAVPTADVVLTNPTHLAIALAYRGDEMAAPRVVAKGADLIAANIRRVALEHGVPLLENKPLARALYGTTEVGTEIPIELFQAVAEVLAYIYAQRERSARTGFAIDGGDYTPREDVNGPGA